MVSDATLVVSVPSHLDVAVFSKLYTPATNKAAAVIKLKIKGNKETHCINQ